MLGAKRYVVRGVLKAALRASASASASGNRLGENGAHWMCKRQIGTAVGISVRHLRFG